MPFRAIAPWLAARGPLMRALMRRFMPIGLAFSRRFGSPAGCLAFEIEGAAGQMSAYASAAPTTATTRP